MMQALKFKVSMVRFFWRIETAFAQSFSIHHDLNTPFSLMRRNTQKSRFVCLGGVSHILQITKTRNFSKVAKFVVLFVSVPMIYVKRWKLASHVQPSKAMRQSFLIVYRNAPIPSVSRATCAFTNKVGSAMMRFPNKIARFWIVIKNRSDMVSGNHEFDFTMRAAK